MPPLWKTIWRFLKKLRIKLSYDSAIPFLGIYLKNTNPIIQKGICTSIFITACFNKLTPLFIHFLNHKITMHQGFAKNWLCIYKLSNTRYTNWIHYLSLYLWIDIIIYLTAQAKKLRIILNSCFFLTGSCRPCCLVAKSCLTLFRPNGL